MKNEPKVKKLVLRKETLRDLTAQTAGGVKGGGATRYGLGCTDPTCANQTCLRCPTFYVCTAGTCKGCGQTKGKHCG